MPFRHARVALRLTGGYRQGSDGEILAEPVDVSGRLDPVVRLLDLPVRADDERGTDNAHHLLAVVHLLAVRAVGGEHRPVRIGQQGERDAFLVAEPRQLGRGIRGDPEHSQSHRREVGQALAEVARLFGAARSHRRGVEVDDHSLTAQRRQRHRVAISVLEREVRRLVAGLEPFSGHRAFSLRAEKADSTGYRFSTWAAMTGAMARNARPRWLIASFSSGGSSAVVTVIPSGTKIGS